LVNGQSAPLAISTEGKSATTVHYDLSAQLVDGKLVYTLARQDGKETYHLPEDFSTCECRDFLSRAHRREDGCCKHNKACQAALKRLGLI
jgi:hypothetical protein